MAHPEPQTLTEETIAATLDLLENLVIMASALHKSGYISRTTARRLASALVTVSLELIPPGAHLTITDSPDNLLEQTDKRLPC
jgi:hypothetical protein